MKREILFLLSAMIVLLPLASSLEIQIPSEVPQGQTVIANITGNFIDPIAKSNIKFYRQHVQTSFDYDVGKIGDYYYIYFQTQGKSANNYSINISGVRYYVGAQISNEPISKTFSVNSQLADFKVNKGFVVTNGNFSLTLQNLQPTTETITLQTKTTSGSTGGFFSFLFKNQEVESEQSITLLSGETNNLNIVLKNITETTTRTITLKTNNLEYKIPAYVIIEYSPENQTTTNTTEENQTTTEPETNTTEENTPTENETIYENTTTEENNTIEENVTEDTGSFWDIFKKENKSTEDEGKNYEVITDEEGNEIIVDEKGDVIEKNVSLKTCSQLKGDICTINEETCDGTKVNALNGECCIGQCVKKETNSNKKIVGWVLIGLIVVLLLWFKSKFSKTKRRKYNIPGIDRRR